MERWCHAVERSAQADEFGLGFIGRPHDGDILEATRADLRRQRVGRLRGSNRSAGVTLLVAVSGPPAAGKSSVAVRLGAALALPVVSRDALKTGMLFTEPPGTAVPYGGKHSVRSWDLFSVMTSQLLQAGVSLVIEQAFLRGRGEAFFEPFLHRSRGLLVQCDVSREESLRRFRRRIADPTRQNPTDVELVGLLETGTLAYDLYEPLDLPCPVLRCDTTDIGTAAFDARLADLVETIRAHREHP